MAPGDAFLAFYTLLLGLGLANLLTGVAGVMRRHRLRELGTTGWLLTALILFEFLSGWSGAPRTFANADTTIAALLPVFVTGACYFLASVLVMPEADEFDAAANLGERVRDRVRMIAALLFVANAMLVIAELPAVADKASTNSGYLWFYVPWNASILVCYGIMIAFPRRRAAPVAMAVLLAAYAFMTARGL